MELFVFTVEVVFESYDMNLCASNSSYALQFGYEFA